MDYDHHYDSGVEHGENAIDHKDHRKPPVYHIFPFQSVSDEDNFDNLENLVNEWADGTVQHHRFFDSLL